MTKYATVTYDVPVERLCGGVFQIAADIDNGIIIDANKETVRLYVGTYGKGFNAFLGSFTEFLDSKKRFYVSDYCSKDVWKAIIDKAVEIITELNASSELEFDDATGDNSLSCAKYGDRVRVSITNYNDKTNTFLMTDEQFGIFIKFVNDLSNSGKI